MHVSSEEGTSCAVEVVTFFFSSVKSSSCLEESTDLPLPLFNLCSAVGPLPYGLLLDYHLILLEYAGLY